MISKQCGCRHESDFAESSVPAIVIPFQSAIFLQSTSFGPSRPHASELRFLQTAPGAAGDGRPDPGGRRHLRGGGASWAVSPGATPYAGIEKKEGGSVAG
jgi:hypothetical protein